MKIIIAAMVISLSSARAGDYTLKDYLDAGQAMRDQQALEYQLQQINHQLRTQRMEQRQADLDRYAQESARDIQRIFEK